MERFSGCEFKILDKKAIETNEKQKLKIKNVDNIDQESLYIVL